MSPRGSRMSRLRQFLQEYGEGVEARDLPRVLGRDATRAFQVLTRDHPEDDQPRKGLRRAWNTTKRLFLGLSYKLSPSRRLLFGGSVLLALLGIQRCEFTVGRFHVDLFGSSLWLILSVLGLVLLVMLELADRVVVRDELEVARQLQAELMPTEPPELPGYEFAFSYRTANTIGGDYYDFVPLADGRLLVAAGDASGHGIAAGLVMAVASSTMKVAADETNDPVRILAMVNAALFRTGGPRAFMTLCAGILDPASGLLEIASAGHPFPLVRRTDGSLDEIGEGCVPLGLRSHVSPKAARVTVGPGELLVFYSDGIPETVDGQGRSFGYDRVQRIVAAGGSAGQVHDRVLAELERFAGDEPPADDRSLVVLRRRT